MEVSGLIIKTNQLFGLILLFLVLSGEWGWIKVASMVFCFILFIVDKLSFLLFDQEN